MGVPIFTMNHSLLFSILLFTWQVTAEVHSSHHLEVALNSKCALRKLYKEHTQKHQHTRPPHEESLRMKLFEDEIKQILAMRQDPLVTWDVGLHFMADMSEAERDLMRGVNGSDPTGDNKLQAGGFLHIDLTKTVPEEFDQWREGHLVGEVRKQLKGSCWAHAATCVIQSVLSALTGYLDELAVQEIYDCAEGRKFYQSAYHVDFGYDYVINTGRLGFEEDTPETYNPIGTMKSCSAYKKMRNALSEYKVSGHFPVPDIVPWEILYHLTYTSPISVSIGTKADNLHSYQGKLYTPRNCDAQSDHAVVMVGYSREAYIIKNSWGADWGDEGYMTWNRNGKMCTLLKDMRVITMHPADEIDQYDTEESEQNSHWDWLWPFNWGEETRSLLK